MITSVVVSEQYDNLNRSKRVRNLVLSSLSQIQINFLQTFLILRVLFPSVVKFAAELFFKISVLIFKLYINFVRITPKIASIILPSVVNSLT